LLSYQIVFCLHLLAETVLFGLLHWTNGEASFSWPATIGAKLCRIREMKTTIETTYCHSCSPHLSSTLDPDGLFSWPVTFGAKLCGIRELKTTIQKIFYHICSPYLSSTLDSDGLLGYSRSGACYPTSLRRPFSAARCRSRPPGSLPLPFPSTVVLHR
jgi:hypothetical protein